ncbi:M23 family metallopeptidase [Streptomyces sp. NPDC005551]|uniref:M23 family metallopeptidase n=1 Tax=Streptomyces sp. NPDC005551 TaxID=3364725 RepID=UPI0036A4C3CC
MAFTRATGKHRRPSRITRTTKSAAGVAALTTTGVIGTLAAPAFAADAASVQQTGLTQAVTIGDTVAEQVDAQAAAQRHAADEAAALKKAEEAAKRRVMAEAKKEREVKARAARAAERKLLNTFVAPVAGSYVSTGYKTGGSLWSSGSHTGVDFHAASGTVVQAVGAGTVVTTGWAGAYGNQVVIKMHDGTYTMYGHLASVNVSEGQTVTPGQPIALSGSTGNSTGPHLHFEARTTAEYGSDIDPVSYLRSHGVSL